MSVILVSENVDGPGLDRLRREHDVRFEPELWQKPVELTARLAAADALIVRNQTQVTRDLLAAAPRLKVIGRAGAGLDNIDVGAADEAGIVVTYTPNENSLSVAELVLGLLLTIARRIPAAWNDTRSGGWKRQEFTGVELAGRTLGLVGFGRIGQLVAKRARAFEMKIIAADAFLAPDAPALQEHDATLMSIDDLLAQADAVSVHVPLTDDTRGMFGYRQFCAMKPTAWFVNSSRGEVVDEPGLLKALNEDRIAAAALDVRHSEPPSPGGLESMDNVILTPHIGAFTREAQERVVDTVCGDVSAVLSGGQPEFGFKSMFS